MEVAGIVLHQVMVMFLLLLTGAAAFKRGIITLDAARICSGLLLKIIIPCIIINAYHQPFSEERSYKLVLAFGLAAAFHFMAIFAAGILFKGDKENLYRIKQLGAIYSNCGFMGFPLLAALFGEEGVFLGTAFFAVFNVFVWIHGVKTLKPGERISIKRILLNPGCAALGVGLLTYFLQISYPRPVIEAIEHLSNMNTPLAMVVTGVFLGTISLRETIKEKTYLFVSLVRTLLLPFLFILCLCLFRVADLVPGAGLVCHIIAICASCPTAATVILLPESLNMDGVVGAKILTVSTLISIVTLPVMTYITFALLG